MKDYRTPVRRWQVDTYRLEPKKWIRTNGIGPVTGEKAAQWIQIDGVVIRGYLEGACYYKVLVKDGKASRPPWEGKRNANPAAKGFLVYVEENFQEILRIAEPQNLPKKVELKRLYDECKEYDLELPDTVPYTIEALTELLVSLTGR